MKSSKLAYLLVAFFALCFMLFAEKLQSDEEKSEANESFVQWLQGLLEQLEKTEVKNE